MISHTKGSPLSTVANNAKIKLFLCPKMKETAVNRSVCQPVNNLIINRETKSDNVSVLSSKIITKVKQNKDTFFCVCVCFLVEGI